MCVSSGLLVPTSSVRVYTQIPPRWSILPKLTWYCQTNPSWCWSCYIQEFSYCYQKPSVSLEWSVAPTTNKCSSEVKAALLLWKLLLGSETVGQFTWGNQFLCSPAHILQAQFFIFFHFDFYWCLKIEVAVLVSAALKVLQARTFPGLFKYWPIGITNPEIANPFSPPAVKCIPGSHQDWPSHLAQNKHRSRSDSVPGVHSVTVQIQKWSFWSSIDPKLNYSNIWFSHFCMCFGLAAKF